MDLEEIRKLMFTDVIGINLNKSETGKLISYVEERSKPYTIRTSKGSIISCINIEPIKELINRPKYRPYENASEIPLDKIMARRKNWYKGNRAAIEIDCGSVCFFRETYMKFREAFTELEWADGTPFGVEIKE